MHKTITGAIGLSLRTRGTRRARYLMVAAMTSAAGLLGATPALTAPPDEIFEFTVATDTVQTPPICGQDGLKPCTFTEGKVPYLLGTLTLTHDALTQHQAQLSDQTNPPTDDGRVISFTVNQNAGLSGFYLNIPPAPLCGNDRLFQSIPPCTFVVRQKIDGEGYTLDLGPIIGNHLSGVIDIVDFQQHGVGCALQMQGSNGNWSGTWECITEGGFAGSLHSFTAIATRIDGHVAQK